MNQAHLVLQSLNVLDNYVVIKLKPNFIHSFTWGDDIDIITSDVNSAIESLYEFHKNYLGAKLHVHKFDNHQAYVDIYEKNKLLVRYDLYENYGGYKRIKIKPHFFF